MEGWPYGFIEFIRKKVSPEYHNVVDLMQRARLEMKAFERGHCPNTKSITDLRETQSLNYFFQALTRIDLDSTHLSVNFELVIDVKALIQMTQQDRDTLIKEAATLNTVEDLDTIELSKDASLVCRKYRLMFDKLRKAGVQRIMRAFRVDSSEGLTFGKIQFVELEPNDVDRVIKVFKESGNKYDGRYCQVIRMTAERFQVDKVLDFVAVAEYAVRRINNRIKSLKEENRNPARPQGVKVIDYFRERVLEEFVINGGEFLDSIYDEFQNLQAECDKHYRNHEVRFETLMAATNHYDKHSYEFRRFNNNEPVASDEYFEIAWQLCFNPEENPTWTQDGSSVSWQIHRHDGAFATRYDNPYKGTAIIATLHVRKKA